MSLKIWKHHVFKSMIVNWILIKCLAIVGLLPYFIMIWLVTSRQSCRKNKDIKHAQRAWGGLKAVGLLKAAAATASLTSVASGGIHTTFMSRKGGILLANKGEDQWRSESHHSHTKACVHSHDTISFPFCRGRLHWESNDRVTDQIASMERFRALRCSTWNSNMMMKTGSDRPQRTPKGQKGIKRDLNRSL